MGSLPLALRWSLLGSLRQQAAARHAALCRCGRCAGPRRWSFSAGARAGPPVSRSARRASGRIARSWSPAKSIDEVFISFLDWSLGSLPLALRWSLLALRFSVARTRQRTKHPAAAAQRGKKGSL